MHAIVVGDLEVVVNTQAVNLDVFTATECDRPARRIFYSYALQPEVVTIMEENWLSRAVQRRYDTLPALPVRQMRIFFRRQAGAQPVPVKKGPVGEFNGTLTANSDIVLVHSPQQRTRVTQFRMSEAIRRIIFQPARTAQHRACFEPQANVGFQADAAGQPY